MELAVLFLGSIVYYLTSVDIVSASSLRHLEERIDFLEKRFNNENENTRHDFETIISRLDVQSDMVKYLVNGLKSEKMANRNMRHEITNLKLEIKSVLAQKKSSQMKDAKPSKVKHTNRIQVKHTKPEIFDSCYDALTKGHRKSGVYIVQGIVVYCDQTTDNGGWTVFQRRINGDVDFFRNWSSYKQGFGNLSGEFWLGNQHLSTLLSKKTHTLRIDLEDFEGNRVFAMYSSFRIGPESDKYALHVSRYSGNAGDSLKTHNGMIFTTKNEIPGQNPNCADVYRGAWWYNKKCYHSNLNGLYHATSKDYNRDGIIWRHWKGQYYSLKAVEMKFR